MRGSVLADLPVVATGLEVDAARTDSDAEKA